MRNRGGSGLFGRGSGRPYQQKNLYRCFCCFHVRSGALALGTWHLMIHLFAICLLAYMSANMDEINSSPSMTPRQTQTLTIVIRRVNMSDPALASQGEKLLTDKGEDKTADSDEDDEPVALPVSMNTGSGVQSRDSGSTNIVVKSSASVRGRSSESQGGMGVASYYWSSFVFNSAGQPIISQRDLNLAFLLGCITLSIALMMLVGIIKGRPAYLIPFLTYQIMDLVVSCLTVAGLICYGPELKDYMMNDSDFPFRDEVASLDSQWATLIAALVILSVVFIKAYFVQVVWLCLRFLKEEKMRRAREECQPKVIYLDNNQDNHPELTMFVFDDQGNVLKDKVPPPTYEQVISPDNRDTVEQTPPAYTATA